MLEVAYWIGDTPGVTPSSTLLAQYGDSSHTVATDRWIVFHFHIALDANTFYRGGNNEEYFYPGVTAISVYQSQTIHTLRNQDPRAEYVFSRTYSAEQNTGVLRNYNARAQALDCDSTYTNSVTRTTNLPRRWYIGRDNEDAIAGLREAGRPVVYSDAMNQFVSHLLSPPPFFFPLSFSLIPIQPCMDGRSESYRVSSFSNKASSQLQTWPSSGRVSGLCGGVRDGPCRST